MVRLLSRCVLEEGLPMRSRPSDQVFARPRGARLTKAALPLVSLAVGLLGALGLAGGALANLPLGPEFQINSYTTGSQQYPGVAIDAYGGFVVVWTSYGSVGNDTSGASLQGQRFNAASDRVGSQFQVNTYTSGNQFGLSLAGPPSGGFVVVWTSYGSSGSDSSGSSIQGQRYDGIGNAVGSEFQVNTYTTSLQFGASVAIDADGEFVVVWTSIGSAGSDTDGTSVQGQRYDASGNAVGSEFQVNTYTTSYQFARSVAADEDGDFVVVWTSFGSAGDDSSASSIQGQRYDLSGNAVGSQFQVNTYTTATQEYPSVAAHADGDFVVVWTSDGGFGPDHSTPSVQGQRYDASGNALGSQFQVNTYSTGAQDSPSVTASKDKNFVVVWTSEGSFRSDNNQTSIQGQRFDADGKLVADEFQVNTYTTGYQVDAWVAARETGHFIVVWQSEGSSGSDNDSTSIQAQGYASPPRLIPSLSPPGAVGLGLLLFGIAAAGLRGRLGPRG